VVLGVVLRERGGAARGRAREGTGTVSVELARRRKVVDEGKFGGRRRRRRRVRYGRGWWMDLSTGTEEKVSQSKRGRVREEKRRNAERERELTFFSFLERKKLSLLGSLDTACNTIVLLSFGYPEVERGGERAKGKRRGRRLCC